MQRQGVYRFLVVFAAVMTLAGVWMVSGSVVLVRDMVSVDERGRETPRKSPGEAFSSHRGAVTDFKFILDNQALSATRMRFVPDDYFSAMRINDIEYFVGGIPGSKRMDYQKGFELDLAKNLKPGPNNIVVTISNAGGSTGLHLRASRVDTCGVLGLVVLGLGLSGLIWVLGKKLRWSLGVIALMIVGIILRIWVLGATPPQTRAYDVDGHIEYVDYIHKHFAIPESSKGWLFYQPALYYVTAAVWSAPAKISWPEYQEPVDRALQVFSLVLFMVFLSISIEILRLALPQIPLMRQRLAGRFRGWFVRPFRLRYRLMSGDRLILLLGTALLVFWPSGILHSVRIGNDSLLYPLAALSLLCILKWYRQRSLRFLILATLVASLAIFTKTNGIVLFAVIGVLLLIQLYRFGFRQMTRSLVIFSVLTIVSGLLAFGPAVYRTATGKQKNIFVGNSSNLNKGLLINNNMGNYIFPDLREYLTQPFVHPWENTGGRQYFINYFLKTSLFGEFRYPRKVQQDLAILLSLGLLFLLVLAGWGVTQKKFPYRLELILFGFFSLFAAVMSRVSMPYACNNDFRYSWYIMPVFVLAVVNGLAMLAARSQRLLWRVSVSVIIAFGLMSIWFWLGV